MRKRQIKFILALCTAAVVLWVGGEIVLDLGLTVSRIWAIAIIVLTCAFSLWKCPRE